jgi:hypothetical protein
MGQNAMLVWKKLQLPQIESNVQSSLKTLCCNPVRATDGVPGGAWPFWIQRLLRAWDRGWALYVRGRQVAGGAKDEVDYFPFCSPSSFGLPPVEQDTAGLGTPLSFSDEERQVARAVLAGLFPAGRPVIVYNPRASNPFTRETCAVKEVDNTLTAGGHSVVTRQVALDATDHELLVAAPVKASGGGNAAGKTRSGWSTGFRTSSPSRRPAPNRSGRRTWDQHSLNELRRDVAVLVPVHRGLADRVLEEEVDHG